VQKCFIKFETHQSAVKWLDACKDESMTFGMINGFHFGTPLSHPFFDGAQSDINAGLYVYKIKEIKQRQITLINTSPWSFGWNQRDKVVIEEPRIGRSL